MSISKGIISSIKALRRGSQAARDCCAAMRSKGSVEGLVVIVESDSPGSRVRFFTLLILSRVCREARIRRRAIADLWQVRGGHDGKGCRIFLSAGVKGIM